MAPPSVSMTLIENVRTRYAGTKEEAFFDEVAKNVAGVAYAGKLTVLSVPPPGSSRSFYSWCRYGKNYPRSQGSFHLIISCADIILMHGVPPGYGNVPLCSEEGAG